MQTTTFLERLRVSLLLLTLALAPGCSGDQDGTGNTNWNLECDSSSECEGNEVCQCGYCGESCSGTLDCSAERKSQCVMNDPDLEAGVGADDPQNEAGADLSGDSAQDAGGDEQTGATADDADASGDNGGADDSDLTDGGTGGSGSNDDDVLDAGSGGGNGTEGSEEDAAVLPGNDGTENMGGAEACSLPIGEWQTMTAQPELNSLDRAVGWRDGALHYMGDGRTRTDVTDSSSHNYGRFDPCSNTWQKTTIERGAEASSLHGWDGNGFTFHPNTAYFVLNTPGLGVTGRAGSYFSLSDETLTLVTEPRVVGNALVYPEDAAPEPLPVIPSYMNGATDGSRAFVWGQPLPTDEDPDPAPRGWMLDSGSLTWREISTQGAPSVRRNHSVVAAGERFVVWGGAQPDNRMETLNDGAFYDPETDSWEAIPTDGAPAGGTSRPLHWIGERLVVHPGSAGGVYTPGEGWKSLEALVGVPTPHKLLIEGDRILFTRGLSIWLLDVASASWVDVPEPTGAIALENGPEFFDVAWSGSTLLFWGSSVPQTCFAPPGVDGCDLANLTLPAGEGVMVRLE